MKAKLILKQSTHDSTHREWVVKYLDKNTSNYEYVPVYKKQLEYISFMNFHSKMDEDIDITLRWCMNDTTVLLPVDTVMNDMRHYHLVAELKLIDRKIAMEEFSSKINKLDDKLRLQWDEFYYTLDTKFSINSSIFTPEVKKYLENYYLPPNREL